MTNNIPTAIFVSESTEDLIKKAERILERYPIMSTATQVQRLQGTSIRSLSPSCYRIEVKNVINVTDSSILVCNSDELADCPGIPPSCPAEVGPNNYVNMVATVNALVAQDNVEITFEYLLNDVPTTTVATVDLDAGSNTVYAFADNVQYTTGTSLALFGAKVTKS